MMNETKIGKIILKSQLLYFTIDYDPLKNTEKGGRSVISTTGTFFITDTGNKLTSSCNVESNIGQKLIIRLQCQMRRSN